MSRILPDGGRGIGVNPRGSDFPFVRPSADVRGLLADAYLAHESRDATPPLRVARIVGLADGFATGTAPARAEIRIADGAGFVVFDSAGVPYSGAPFGPRLLIHEWTSDVAVCRIVQHTAFPPGEGRDVPADLSPVDGTLDARVGVPMPRRVRRFHEMVENHATAGSVVFANGHNIEIAVGHTTVGLRSVTQLTFSATPGSGLGRFPGCVDPELVLRSFNGVRGDDRGDFRLDASGCYFVRQPVAGSGAGADVVPATLRVGNDCGPCCECDDYVRVQRGALGVWGRISAVGVGAEATRDEFASVVAAWQAEKACVDAKVVEVTLAPFGGIYVEVVVSVCNHSAQCLVDVSVTLSVETDAGAVTLVGEATTITDVRGNQRLYAPGGDGPWTAFFDAIQAMSSGTFRTRFAIPLASAGTTVAATAAASAPAPLPPGVLLPQATTTTITMGA
jgi:hypothetical protein